MKEELGIRGKGEGITFPLKAPKIRGRTEIGRLTTTTYPSLFLHVCAYPHRRGIARKGGRRRQTAKVACLDGAGRRGKEEWWRGRHLRSDGRKGGRNK